MRRHLTYANIAATLALLFAMSGGALAASHYLINSTRQINPKVLKRLKGNRGARGATGVPGIAIQGPSGTPGAKGQRGEVGHEGPAGLSALSTLPSGKSENGVYGIAPDNSASSGALKQSITLPLSLATAIPAANVQYIPSGGPLTPACPGAGRAERGFLCIYSGGATGVNAPLIFEPEDGASTAGSGRIGFILEWAVTAVNASDVGSYTVTAP
jgi:hypothetical protein